MCDSRPLFAYELSSVQKQRPMKTKSDKVGCLKGHPAHVSTPTRFELARAEPIGFQNQLLNHSDTVSPALDVTTEFSTGKKSSTPTRFELARAEPSRFRIYLLNHSDTVSCARGPVTVIAKAKGRGSTQKSGLIANPSFDLGTFRL